MVSIVFLVAESPRSAQPNSALNPNDKHAGYASLTTEDDAHLAMECSFSEEDFFKSRMDDLCKYSKVSFFIIDKKM